MTWESNESPCFTQGTLWPVIETNFGNRHQLGKGFYQKEVGKFAVFSEKLENWCRKWAGTVGGVFGDLSQLPCGAVWQRCFSCHREVEASLCPGCCTSVDTSHHLWSHCPVKRKQLPWIMKQCSPLTQVFALMFHSQSHWHHYLTTWIVNHIKF